MKSNKTRIKTKFVWDYGISNTFDDTLEEYCEFWEAFKMEQFEEWIDDDSWLTLPTPPYLISCIKLNSDMKPTFVEFTEQPYHVGI